MSDIRHHLGIDAPQAQVHQALTTRDGLAAWWTQDTRGEAGEGGKLAFYFGGEDAAAVMAVEEVTADRVVWRCVEGPDEWLDTTFTFELDHADGETMVLFTNAGWREPVTFQAHCSTKWGYFLLELKSALEGGRAHPYPHDRKISSWG